MKKNNSINSNAYAYLKSLIGDRVKIIDVIVWGRYLKASLSSGVYFSVLNQDTD
jgi:hypothetical protein